MGRHLASPGSKRTASRVPIRSSSIMHSSENSAPQRQRRSARHGARHDLRRTSQASYWPAPPPSSPASICRVEAWPARRAEGFFGLIPGKRRKRRCRLTGGGIKDDRVPQNRRVGRLAANFMRPWVLAHRKSRQYLAKEAGNQTHVPAAEQGVVREGECNPESGGGYH
jgi:hypothetical protein